MSSQRLAETQRSTGEFNARESLEHQRCVNMPAEGNALGAWFNKRQALKEREKVTALSGLFHF